MKPPRTQPTITESLKKIVRGLCGSVRSDCTPVLEKTAICDSIGTCSASSRERRYPCASSNFSSVLPSRILRSNSATGLDRDWLDATPAARISTNARTVLMILRAQRENKTVSFLDNLENNLKALEGRDEGLDDARRRESDRERMLEIAPWAERLKREPYAEALMRAATLAGRPRRIKVNLAWIESTLRLEARGYRLELRPTVNGVV